MLQIKDIHKEYKTGSLVQKALDGVSLSLRDNEFIAVLGPSGSGKTTLLNVIGGLDRYDSGEMTIRSVPTSRYNDRDWDTYRNHTVGFIFQSYNLIPHQTLLRNVELALTLTGVPAKERRQRAEEALDKVGLKEQMHKKPAQLSGGQMQRVAIARALVNDPAVVLADEPTGALDSETGEQVMQLLKEVARDRLVVMVTHNPDLAQRYASRIVKLRDGRVISDTDPYDPKEESTRKAGAAESAGGAEAAVSSGTAGGTEQTVGAGTAVSTGQAAAAGAADHAEDKKRGGKRQKKPSMSFLTALSLSVSNLISKKARTLLVAFAASIGIIGIALILSLSNGANNYIHKMEEESLSQYPLELSSSSFSMEDTMLSFAQMARGSEGEAQGTSAADGSGSGGSAENGSGSDGSGNGSGDQVQEQQFLGGMFSGVGTNDLGSLRRWFESGYSEIEDYTRGIEYRYGISPQVYLKEENGYRQVNPDKTWEAMGVSTDDNLTGLMSSWGTNDAFRPIPENDELYKDAYELRAGHWPEKDTDCVLVLTGSGGIPDILLYTMGLKDANELNNMISGVLAGENTDTSIQKSKVYEPEEFLGISFSVLPACDHYVYDEKLGIFVDVSSDTAAMEKLLDDAVKLEITGVAAPRDRDSIGLLEIGIDYPAAFTEKLIETAANSEVVKAQLAAPEIDVTTGMAFGEVADDQSSSMFEEMFSIHPENISDAVSVDWSRLDSLETDDTRLTAKRTVKILREISRTGESPTLSKMLDNLMPLLFDLVQIDEEKIGEVITMEMDEAHLQEMFRARAQAASATYQGNLIKFGYADTEEPSMITIYPKDFESKENVLAILDAYNAAMKDAGEEEKVISYTDYVGSLMSSVTTIIDVITYVLIAFVAVSLVVSSIMIGIITYISVLERRKEIGILRAMGASKRNITEVFNAETFIIGMLAGVFGIGLTLLIQIPLNRVIHTLAEGQDVRAVLPPGAGTVLVVLCVVLTFIGGFIPSRKAARQDPVDALRSE